MVFKKVSGKYLKRVRGLFRYIFDYKILFFSLLYVSLSFVGLNILRNIDAGSAIGLVLLLICVTLFFSVGFLLLRNISKDKKSGTHPRNSLKKGVHFFGISTLVFLTALLAFVRITPLTNQERVVEEKVSSFTEQYVSFEAYIVEESDKRYRIQQLKLKQLQDVSKEDQILHKEHGYILTRVENYRKFNIGQVCKFSGTLVQPENFSDFDYKTHLKNQKIFFILDNPFFECIDIGERREGNILRNTLVDMKDGIIERIDEKLHEPYSSLLAGILFGKKRRLERQFEENLRVGGVSHVITASGYNITILIIMINRLVFFLPKRFRVVVCLILIWCFAILTGLSNSIIRACIMNTLSLFAVLFGRDNKVHISLPFTAAIFVFFDPLIVINVGFLLSISAILGIVYISPILKSAKETITRKWKFVDNYIFPTLSCTIGTLPIAVYTFKTFSIWSVPVNTLVLPVIESTMLWGVLSLLSLSIHPALSSLFFDIVSLQLSYFEYIVNVVGGLSLGSWEIPEVSSIVISVFLLISIFAAVIYFHPIENEEYNHYLKNN